MELTVDDVWQIADAGDQELQRLARNIHCKLVSEQGSVIVDVMKTKIARSHYKRSSRAKLYDL